MTINVEGKSGRAGSKKGRSDTIEDETRAAGAYEGDVEFREKRRSRTGVADPK